MTNTMTMTSSFTPKKTQTWNKKDSNDEEEEENIVTTSVFWFRRWFMMPLHFAIRIVLANRMPISDCDETFNYWEPLHFMLYQHGFQTWEYSNEFALRTYAYLTPLWGIAKMYHQAVLTFNVKTLSWFWPILTEQNISTDKVAVFVLMRSTLGAWMAWAEVSLVCSIADQATRYHEKDDQNTKLWFLFVSLVTEFLLLTSAGMGHTAAALLPSSTIMGLWMFAAAAFVREQHTWFITLAVTATLAVGWPFGVIVFVPLGIKVMVREFSLSNPSRVVSLFGKILLVTSVIQCTVMAIDYQHYGRVVSPIWNILVYNTQAAGGDELYGIEPLSYYVKNLLLNFNYVTLGGIMAGVVAPFVFSWNDSWILLLPIVSWLAVVGPRPHKEERFLFPIYPSLCLGAAMLSVTVAGGMVRWRIKGTLSKRSWSLATMVLLAIIWGPAAFLSCCRSRALMKYYIAPLLLYSKMPKVIFPSHDKRKAVVCTCGEWYRFTSHFYVPEQYLSFGFASSTFGGQLPQPFTIHGSSTESKSSNKFNDKNEPEPGSITPMKQCDYLVELSTSLDSCTEGKLEWSQILIREPFLNVDATSMLHRTLYIPLLHEKATHRGKVQFAEFALYEIHTSISE